MNNQIQLGVIINTIHSYYINLSPFTSKTNCANSNEFNKKYYEDLESGLFDINDVETYLPIGKCNDEINSLEWKRTDYRSDFDIIYKGQNYKISHVKINYIQSKIQKSYDIEYILKTYLDNNQDINFTFLQLIT
jgi:hypothetical protein